MGSIFFFKQKTAYEMRISDLSSDVCSSDLEVAVADGVDRPRHRESQHEEAGHEEASATSHRLGLEVREPRTEVAHRPLVADGEDEDEEPGLDAQLKRDRSEESSVGKEDVSTSRARWSPEN